MAELTLPEGAVLVHIGPMKTGTTAIQYALSDARAVLVEHGVRYPGTRHRGMDHYRQMDPILAVLGRRYVGLPQPPIEEWEALVAEVRAGPHERACISSEDLGSARPHQARRIVEELGAERVHVVVTARRLDRLLPSQWQQRVKNQEVLSYADWLEIVLGPDPEPREHQRFWHAQDITAMYDVWGPLVGPERFIVIVSDDSDRRLLHDTFESMLGLPAETLQSTSANTSLSAGSVELLRRINTMAAEEEWPEWDYRKLVRRGLADKLKGMRVPEDAPIPPIPSWAVDRVNAHQAEVEEFFSQRPVRIVGDLTSLRVPSERGRDGIDAMPRTLRIDEVAAAVEGLRAGLKRQVIELRSQHREELADLEAGHLHRMQELQHTQAPPGSMSPRGLGRGLRRAARRAAARARSAVRGRTR